VVPALDALRSYRWKDARADLLAGLTVASVAVPQAMAYAMIAGLPVERGLYTAVVMTAAGALFNSSRQLVNGPTNAISIALLSAIATTTGDPVNAAILLALLAGGMQLGVTFLRLGDLTRYISHSVIVGFTAGASALLLLDQLKNLLGLKAAGDPHDHFLVRFARTLLEGGHVQPETLAIGLCTIAAAVGLRWAKNRVGWVLFPEFLVVVLGAAAAVWAFDLEARGVKVVGAIPGGLPSFSLPRLDPAELRDLAPSAVAIATLGLLEAMSMAKAIATQTGQKLDMNQQCLSEGIANVAGALFGCMPGSGSLTRSAINQQAGAVTQWSGVISAVAVAATMVLFAPYARFVPRSALAGLLMLTAVRMVDVKQLRYHWRASRFDAIIVAATGLAAVVVSVEFCVLIGVLLSFLLAVPRAGRAILTEFVAGPDGIVHERLPTDDGCARMRIFGLEGEMFFGAAPNLERHFDTIAERLGPETRVLVLRLKRFRTPDAVGMHLLEDFLDRIEKRGIVVLVCGVRDELHRAFRRTGLATRMPAERVFREQPVRQTSTMLAVRHACEIVASEDRCRTCPRLAARAG
jgi:SulP family sulfate permease